MPRLRNYGTRQSVRSAQRATQALDLWLHRRLTYRQIGAELGCSASQAGRLIRGALQRAARERAALAHVGLDQTLATIGLVQAEAYDAMVRPCPKCHGHGTRNAEVCARCVGTGYWYDLTERRKCWDRLLRAADQRSKLLGEYAPQDHRLVDGDGEAITLRDIVLRMPPDEVAREAAHYLQGVDDARAALPAPTNEEGTPSG